MDWYQLLLVIVGAVLGFALSIVTTIINKAIDKKGNLYLFYKLVYQKETSLKARVESNGGEMYLIVPLNFEFQNTSNTARVIRDVCLYLYKNGNQVAKMIQVQYTKNTKTNEVKNNFGGDKNSYSFVLPPLSIQKQECEFVFKIQPSEIEEYDFDEIRFSYFDERNNVMECVLCSAEKGWNGIDFNYANKYIELKCKKKK